MSVYVWRSVWGTKIGSSTKKLVLLAMSDTADDDGKCIWTSSSTIAKNCELTKKTVLKMWAELEKEGLIIHIGNRKVRGGLVKIWAINIAALKALDATESLTSPCVYFGEDQ